MLRARFIKIIPESNQFHLDNSFASITHPFNSKKCEPTNLLHEDAISNLNSIIEKQWRLIISESESKSEEKNRRKQHSSL